MVPPSSIRISRVPTYSSLSTRYAFSCTGLSPSMAGTFQSHSTKTYKIYDNRALPLSLATTYGISVDFFSSRYLDVSVPWVRFSSLCIQLVIPHLRKVGFPIQTSSDQCLFASSPKLFAGYHVLHRLLLPRHPPYALIHLTI